MGGRTFPEPSASGPQRQRQLRLAPPALSKHSAGPPPGAERRRTCSNEDRTLASPYPIAALLSSLVRLRENPPRDTHVHLVVTSLFLWSLQSKIILWPFLTFQKHRCLGRARRIGVYDVP